MPRLTRTEKKELVTGQLLETANRIFLERGYHRSTLDDIAEAAGLTKGAVYARFASKDELFFALYAQREAHTIARLDPLPESTTFEAGAREVARRLVELRRQDPDWYLLLLEFWTYAARDERLRREFATRHEQSVRRIAARLQRDAEHFGVSLAIPALALARAGSAMAHGFTLERIADPSGVPENLLESLFSMLAHEATGATPSKRRTNANPNSGARSPRTARRTSHDKPTAAARSRSR